MSLGLDDIHPIFLEGRKVGEINFSRRFYFTRRSYPHHYFRIFKGYGLSRRVLDQLVRYHIYFIQIQESRVVGGVVERRVLWFRLEDWLKHGRVYRDWKGRQPGDYSVDCQVVCPLKYAFKNILLKEVRENDR